MIIGIHQPNFLPWFGYFAKVWRSDLFVFLDDAPISKTGGSNVNRCRILDKGQENWLTIPIKRQSGLTRIMDVEISDLGARSKVAKTLRTIYGRRPYFKEIMYALEDYFMMESPNLCEANLVGIEAILGICGIKKKLIRSSLLSVPGVSTERLLNIIQACGGDCYLSGIGGDNYQDRDAFSRAGISFAYNSFVHPEYRQTGTQQFVPGLSILDFLFESGPEHVRAALESLPPPVIESPSEYLVK